MNKQINEEKLEAVVFTTMNINVPQKDPDTVPYIIEAKENAQKLKLRYIETLCREEELSIVPNNLDQWIHDHKELNNIISLTTYGQELIRRSKFMSQGEGILVLWREIAWKDNHLNKKFKLSANVIIKAESRILDTLKN